MANYRKNLLLVLWCGMLCAPGSAAFALGLGKLDYSTHLGQPLQARIELVGVSAADVADLAARLASPDDFSRFGIAYSQFDGLEISVESDKAGRPYVLIQTRESVNEPILQFVLEVRGYGSTVLGDYTVLLDPAPAAPVLTAKEKADTAPAEPLRISSVPPRAAPTSRTRDTSFGPTQRNDTLWSIAKEVRPSGTSIEQTMLALVRENPDAFYDDNVNRLKAGSTLKLPDESAVQAMSAEEAAKEVRRQSQQWLAYKRRLAQGKTAPPSQALKAASPEPAKPAQDASPQLVLSAPDSEAAVDAQTETKPTGAADTALAALEQSIIENNALRDKVSQLEARIRELDSTLAARDEQLADLSQKSMAATSTAATDSQALSATVEGDTLTSSLVNKLDIRAIYAVTGTILAVLLIAFFVRRMRRTNHEETEQAVGAASFEPHRR